MGRYVILAIFIIAIGFVGYQIYGIAIDYRDLVAKISVAQTEAERITGENAKLKERIYYLSEPENLIQEIKRKFNFRLPEERTIIVAPPRQEGLNE